MERVRVTIVTLITLFYIVTGKTYASHPWPDTGQSTCYNQYSSIPCPQQGQPFYGQDAQYDGFQPSYTKLDNNGTPLPDTANSWSMVKDNITGLIWEVKTNTEGIHNRDTTYTWCNSNLEYPGVCSEPSNTETFLTTLNNSNYGGYSDWRLPTVKELATLLKSNSIDPAINITFFPNTLQSGDFPNLTS